MNPFNSVMAKLGYHPTAESVSAFRNLWFVQTGSFDGFDQLADKIQAAIAEFESKSEQKMQEFVSKNEAADQKRLQSIEAAANVLAKAQGRKVDTAGLRNAAKVMLQAVNFFNMINWLPAARKALHTLLDFVGVSDDVILQMQEAAQSKINEAVRLENEAAEALRVANENDEAAQALAEQIFKEETEALLPLQAESQNFKDLATSFRNTLKLISAK